MAASCEVLAGATPSAFHTVPLLVASNDTTTFSSHTTTTIAKRRYPSTTTSHNDSHLPQGVPLRIVPEDTKRKADAIHRTRSMLTKCCEKAFLQHHQSPNGDNTTPATTDAVHPLASLLMEWAAAELLQMGDVQAAAPLLATVAQGLDKRLSSVQTSIMEADLVPLCVSVFPSGTPASALSPTKGGAVGIVSSMDRHERRRHRDKLKQRNAVSLSSVRRLSYIGTVCGGGLIELFNSHEASVRLCLSGSTSTSSTQQQQSLQSLCAYLTPLVSLAKDSHTSRLRWGTTTATAAADWPDWESTYAALVTQQLLAAQLQPLDTTLHHQSSLSVSHVNTTSQVDDALQRLVEHRETLDHTQLLPLLGTDSLRPSVEMTDGKLAARTRTVRQHLLTVGAPSSSSALLHVRGGSSPPGSPTTMSQGLHRVGTMASLEALAFNTFQTAVLLEASVDCRRVPCVGILKLVDAREAYKVAVAMLELREELSVLPGLTRSTTTTVNGHHSTKIALCEALIGISRVEAKMVAQSRLEVVNRDRAAMAKQQSACGKAVAIAQEAGDLMSSVTNPHILSSASNMADVSNPFTGTIPLDAVEQDGFNLGSATRYARWATDVFESTFGWGSQPAGPDRRQHLLVALLEARCNTVRVGIRTWCKAVGHVVSIEGITHIDKSSSSSTTASGVGDAVQLFSSQLL
eukprot:TRINITY_DN14787_c0_g1_i9.p1 TRINITY_DN14787_c0_g1~~TRINITY_DN14787_c0_g1_i9.p1  ORF type:complete len:688 (-),score=78.74 TRINITY_DN14787_c0_g1_i9:177-2240(-)